MLHRVSLSPSAVFAAPARTRSTAVGPLSPRPIPRPMRGTCQCSTDARRFVRDGAGAVCVPSAMWIFTRQQARDEGLVAKARGIAVAKGIDVSVLKYVNQTACLPAA